MAATSDETVLQASGLVRRFAGGAGAGPVDLDVQPGEIHALVGLNGAGKTTLLRLLLGMLRPDAGVVRIHGRDLNRADASTWRSVGHFIGRPLAYPELDCRTNLRLVARLRGLDGSAATAAVDRAITELDLQEFAAVRASRLSMGNLQRLGLAAATLHDPRLLVLDEPTNALDPRGVILLREALLARCRTGASVLLSSHHLDEVARLGDRMSIINRGVIIGSVDPDGVDIERTFFSMVRDDEEGQQQ